MISEERLRELWHLEGSFASGPYGDEVGRFARAVEAEAYEAAERACKAIADAPRVAVNFYDPDEDGERRGAEQCAEAIRALKEKP